MSRGTSYLHWEIALCSCRGIEMVAGSGVSGQWRVTMDENFTWLKETGLWMLPASEAKICCLQFLNTWVSWNIFVAHVLQLSGFMTGYDVWTSIFIIFRKHRKNALIIALETSIFHEAYYFVICYVFIMSLLKTWIEHHSLKRLRYW